MATFTPYQVDFSVKNAAKNLGFSKKRVSFKFGFADQKSLESGLNGPACRGSEHELVFIWSLGSGKRQLLLDNSDLHFSESGQNGWTVDHTWQHSFTLNDKATRQSYRFNFITQPASKDRPDVRPFDLVVGGLSYFQFNPIYELGTAKMIAMPVSDAAGRRASSPISAEERRQLAAAKLASLRDLAETKPGDSTSQASGPGLKRVEEVSLIDFGADEAPPPMPPANPYGQQPATSSGNYLYNASSMTMDAAIDENVSTPGSNMYGTNPYGAPAPPQPGANPYFGAPAAPSYGAPAPYGAPPPPPAGALPPSQASVNSGFPQPAAPPAGYPPATNQFAPQQPGYPQAAQQQPGFQPYGTSNTTAVAPYQPQQQQPPYGGMPPQQQQPYNNYSLTSPSTQSQVSYGSAPSFAQPPPQQYQQPPPNPQYPYNPAAGR